MVQGQAMRKVCGLLKDKGIDLSRMRALEFFGREGDWQTTAYAGEVMSLEAWEIDPKFEPALRRNLPDATIRIGDSYEIAAAPENKGRFDFVVLDNPQCLFGEELEHCEHFDALPLGLGLIEKEGGLIFNINWMPFDFDEHPHWKKERENYYGLGDTSMLDVEGHTLPFYRRKVESHGFEVSDCFEMVRNPEYLSYIVVVCRRNGAV